jgi:hypothetical protein
LAQSFALKNKVAEETKKSLENLSFQEKMKKLKKLRIRFYYFFVDSEEKTFFLIKQISCIPEQHFMNREKKFEKTKINLIYFEKKTFIRGFFVFLTTKKNVLVIV